MTVLSLGKTALWAVFFYLLGPAWTWAQPGPPPGGYRLRAVRALPRVPEPPGGLVPFREGTLWGYADTTGRIVIAPQLDYKAVAETSFLVNGFAEIGAAVPDKFTRRPEHTLHAGRHQLRAAFINAHGQLLLIAKDEAAIIQPDGSLARRRRPRVLHQPKQLPLEYTNLSPDGHTGFDAYGPRPMFSYDPAPSPYYYTRRYQHQRGRFWSDGGQLGQHRVAIANRMLHGSPRFRPDTTERHLSARELTRQHNPLALATQNGRRLTRLRFADIEPFVHGLARAEVVLYRGRDSQGDPLFEPRWGYLNRHARWRIPPRFTDANDFRAGYAVVEVAGGPAGVIDTTGRFVYQPQPYRLSDMPDEAGFVRRRLVDSTRRAAPYTVQLLPPPGTAFVGDSLFSQAGPFRHGRAWVRQNSRHGLIDQQGRWRTALPYELLVAPSTLSSPPSQLVQELEREVFWSGPYWPGINAITEQRYPTPAYPEPDTAYLLARRAGRYGFVARHSGREVVPCRYVQVRLNLYRGFGCAERNDTAYVINAQGQEVVAGTYSGIDFQTAQGRLLHLRRPRDSTWALLDTTGRLRTAWLPGNGYPVAGGWYLSREGSCWTVREASGRLAYRSAYPIQHHDFEELWAGIARKQQAGTIAPVPFTPYWDLAWELPQPPGRVFFTIHEPATTRLLDVALTEIGQSAYPLATDELLTNGWYAVPLPPGTRQRPAPNYQLLTDEGNLLPPLANNTWAISAGFDYSRLYNEHGLLLTAKGFMARSGRIFWKN